MTDIIKNVTGDLKRDRRRQISPLENIVYVVTPKYHIPSN